ncbi:LANO_0H10616g1_1 [Lachancea nothofagi CBS 11611]|uniref:LANO_0H10616g1_1 n=1 Tax=Lachancea nothofagi CBS 11611 TaxID=1266666 RepID=A0A1G4KM60_9SACH|nr:LANO_0H10616g1_1 [Lachancea nothofagi CBS 11611]
MDEFSKLSLVDSGSAVQEEDLQAILGLNICENDSTNIDSTKKQISQRVMDRLLSHAPSSPSPLRQSVFIDEAYDEMDVDPVEESTSQGPSAENIALENDLLVETESEDEEKQQLASPNSRAVIRALLSPTSLGVAAATKLENAAGNLDDQEEINGVNASEHNSTPMHELKDASTGVALNPADLNELRQRSQHQPIQISINNNHFYYPPPGFQPQTERVHHDGDSLKLPNPWSVYSRPASRVSYNLTSYLQISLNAFTVLAFLSFVLIFMRALKADLGSAWHVAKMELSSESSQCRVQYDVNNCDRSTRVEAMEAQCNRWEKCMARNNDLFFGARTAISAQLVGDVVNSFVEPLGWKTLGVVLSGLAIWCFSSNFILGFARAKSYYGDAHFDRSLKKGRTEDRTRSIMLQDYDNELME